MTNTISSLTEQALQAGARTFSAVHAVAHTISCASCNLLNRGWANARALDQEPTSPEFKYVAKSIQDVPTTKKWGAAYDNDKSGPKVSIGAEFKHKVYERDALFFGDKDNHLRVGHVEAEIATGYSFDPEEKAHNLDLFKLGAKVAVVQAQVKGIALENAVELSGEAEALTAQVGAGIGLTYSEDGDISAEAEVGAEAVLVKGGVKGQINLTPKTIYDNTVGRLVGFVRPGSKWAKAPKALDHGIVIGGQGEIGIAAAAKAKAQIGKDKDTGAWGLSMGAKVGAGPMAGICVFLGIK